MNFIKEKIKILFLALTAIFCINAQDGKPNKENNNNQLKRGIKLNKILIKELAQLNKIKSMLLFIGSVINNDNKIVQNKKEVKNWINDIQKTLNNIEKSHSLPLTKTQLNYISIATKTLINHIIETLENNFTQLNKFELPVFRNSKVKIASETINNRIESNNIKINDLQIITSEIGLTNGNKIARKIDKFIDDYSIVQLVDNIIPVCCASAIALYLTPVRIIEKLPFKDKLIKLKKNKIIGSCNLFEDNYGYNAIYGKDKPDEKKDQLEKTLVDKIFDSGSLKHVERLFTVGGVLWPLISKNESWQFTGPVRREIRSWWNHCKGFTYDGITRNQYEVIENLTLDDECLIGLESQVEELKQYVLYVTNPEMYDRSRSNLEKGVLIEGPSRNGKTYLAKAMAGSINQELKKSGNSRIVFRELKYKDIDWSVEGIKTVIEQAKRNAPCIIFFDELHTLKLQVKEGGADMLQTFLTGMGGINEGADYKHQVIFLAATNQAELLDNALLQSGRFGKIIRVEAPLREHRKKYFEVIFKHNSLNTDDIDLDSLVDQTEGCSYGDLASIVKTAKFEAQSLAKGVTQEHLQKAIDSKIFRLKSDCQLTATEKKHLAAHQAGHALMHNLLNTQGKLLLVSIKGRWRKIHERRYNDPSLKNKITKGKNTKYGLIATYNPNEAVKIENYDEKIKQAKIKLAGPLAEQLLLGSPGYSVNKTEKFRQTFHANDKIKALEYIRTIVYNGLSKEDLPKSVIEELEMQAYKKFKEYEQETLDFLAANRTILEDLAKELEENLTLNSSQLNKILNKK